MEEKSASPPNQWNALNELRGLAVLGLIIYNALTPFQNIPVWLRHSTGNGWTPTDLIAPLFIFSLGLSYALSLQNRLEKYGIKKTLLHFVKRSITLIIFGFLGEIVIWKMLVFRLGLFGIIGLSSLIALPFLLLPYKTRSLAAVLLIILWQLIQYFGFKALSAHDLGGGVTSPAWASIIIFASILADSCKKHQPENLEIYGITLINILIGLHLVRSSVLQFIPVNKSSVTVTYILLGMEISVLLLSYFWLKEMSGYNWKILLILGKNPLFLYIVSGLLGLFSGAFFSQNLPLIYIIPVAATQISISLSIAWLMDKKKIYLKI